jgi:hypothetical protein
LVERLGEGRVEGEDLASGVLKVWFVSVEHGGNVCCKVCAPHGLVEVGLGIGGVVILRFEHEEPGVVDGPDAFASWGVDVRCMGVCGPIGNRGEGDAELDVVPTCGFGVPVWVSVEGVDVDVFSDGFEEAIVKGSGGVPVSLSLRVGEVFVLAGVGRGGGAGWVFRLV